MNTHKHPFAVRKQTSGYSGIPKYIVVKNPGGRRVSTEAHINKDSAQSEADELNIMKMTTPQSEDPRPYEIRFAEARERYNGEKVDGR